MKRNKTKLPKYYDRLANGTLRIRVQIPSRHHETFDRQNFIHLFDPPQTCVSVAEQIERATIMPDGMPGIIRHFKGLIARADQPREWTFDNSNDWRQAEIARTMEILKALPPGVPPDPSYLRIMQLCLGGSFEAKPIEDRAAAAIPVAGIIDLDDAIKVWKARHAKDYGGFRDDDAEHKAATAKRTAAEAMFAYVSAETGREVRSFLEVDRHQLQRWADSMTAGQAYYAVNHVKALYTALDKANRFADGYVNPGDKVSAPAKPKGEDRLPMPPTLTARVLDDARRQEPAIRWGHWVAAFTGFITSEMFGAKVSEIKQIDGIDLQGNPVRAWVWDCRERKLKSAFRSRVVPIHPVLIAEGFLDYVEARREAGDELLFDLTPAQAANALRGHLRDPKGLDIQNAKHVHYSWRHDFTSQLDRFPDRVSGALARVLTGHAAPDVHERNYIHKHLGEMVDAVALIGYPVESLRKAA